LQGVLEWYIFVTSHTLVWVTIAATPALSQRALPDLLLFAAFQYCWTQQSIALPVIVAFMAGTSSVRDKGGGAAKKSTNAAPFCCFC
jgi:hypothetical protein